MFFNWFGLLKKPKKLFEHEKEEASLASGVLHYAVAGFLIGAWLASGFPLASLVSPFANSRLLEFLPRLARLLFLPFVCLASAIFLSVVFSFALFVSAKFFKGKGSFEQQYYLTSLYEIPVASASLPLFLLSLVPLAGSFLVSAAAFLATLYSLYLLYLALRTAHALDKTSALLAVAVPALLFAFALAFGALIRGAIG